MINKSTIGNRGESLVVEHLQKQGIIVLAKNFREKFAEIDIVAKDADTICFVEVRTREDTRLGHPLETVNAKKQASIRRAAEFYLSKKGLSNQAVRFDVATIVWSTMEFTYIKNAF